MRRIFYCMVFPFIICSSIQAQNSGSLPSLVPPSPNVSSLVKAESAGVSLHTGTANVSIPIYELRVGEIVMPISLNYSSNGTRVNDIASRVGLGWNLAVGGVVSKTVHDEEDDGASTIKLNFPGPSANNDQMIAYVKSANLQNYDTERDEYSFSVSGYSGKFYIDDAGLIRQVEHSNLRIQKINGYFVITTPNGTQYDFGGPVEKTIEVKTNGHQRISVPQSTAFFLRKITDVNGSFIHFEYLPISTKAFLGPFQSVILKSNKVLVQPPISTATDCVALCSEQISTPGYNRVDYQSHYLSSITTSNGQQVYFVYQNRPDASQDNRIVEVSVYTSNSEPFAKKIKSIGFEYEDYPIANDINQRFFLKNLVFNPVNDYTIHTPQVYNFEYFDPSSLPSQKSFQQDYYGFSKGNASEPYHFFPRPKNPLDYNSGNSGADRSPNFETTRAGVLRKINYPTGGLEEFEYEGHSIAVGVPLSELVDTVFTNSSSITGIGLNFSSANTYTLPFTVNGPNTRLRYLTEWNSTSGPAPGTSGYYQPDSIHFISYFEIWDVGANTRVFEDRHKYYGTTYAFPLLSPGVNYEMRLKVMGNSHRSLAILETNPQAPGDSLVLTARPACGIRVKSITKYDPVSQQRSVKYYKYRSATGADITSGIGEVNPSFASNYLGGGLCNTPSPNPLLVGYFNSIPFTCPEGSLLQINSSSVNSNFTFSGSPVAYKYVTESDDEFFQNGCIEHDFYTYYARPQVWAIYGSEVPGTGNANMQPSENGTEIGSRVFKKNGSQLTLVRETIRKFSADTRIDGQQTNYTVRNRFSSLAEPVGPAFSFSDFISAFDVNGYSFLTSWTHLDSVVERQYDGSGMNPMISVTSYAYNSTSHLQPTAITGVDSKNTSFEKSMKYPIDFAHQPYTSMLANHIVGPIVETSTFNQVSGAISTEKSNYQTFGTNQWKPSSIQVSKGANPLEERVHIFQYDANGNILRYKNESNKLIEHIWNYQRSFLEAEVLNVSHEGRVAYTSFEGDEYGYWDVSDRTSIIEGGFTGLYAYTGKLTFQPSVPGNYTITLWAKDGNPPPNVNSESGIVVERRGGWILFKWMLSSFSGNITVEGEYIDEVRLTPSESTIKTYTWLPFIGLTSASNENNEITRYSYDGFGRLTTVKDIDFNIVRHIAYRYHQPIAPCPDTLALWIPTGIKTCVIVPQTGNYTGEQKFEERDMNNCSKSYLQTRWTSLGFNGACQPIPNCTGEGKRVVNGVCEIGTRVNMSSVQNGTYWLCTYKYVWSDGFESKPYNSVETTNCLIGVTDY